MITCKDCGTQLHMKFGNVLNHQCPQAFRKLAFRDKVRGTKAVGRLTVVK